MQRVLPIPGGKERPHLWRQRRLRSSRQTGPEKLRWFTELSACSCWVAASCPTARDLVGAAKPASVPRLQSLLKFISRCSFLTFLILPAYQIPPRQPTLIKLNRQILWVSHFCRPSFPYEDSQCQVSESESVSRSVVSDSLWPSGLLPSRLLCPWNSPGESTGVGCHALLQGIFHTQE